MPTIWSVILNRIDNALGKPPWKEWRAMVVDVSEGPPSAGSIPMLGPDGLLAPSMIPSSGPSPQIVILTAGMNINAFQAISIHPDGLAYLADASTTSDAGHVVGVSITSATTGNTFHCQQIGVVDNGGFLFTPGSPIFLGFSGSLVESLVSGSTFQQPMGISVSSSQLLVEVGLPIILS
jgi:hypothetical protein